jgi:hypothetical protein
VSNITLYLCSPGLFVEKTFKEVQFWQIKLDEIADKLVAFIAQIIACCSVSVIFQYV